MSGHRLGVARGQNKSHALAVLGTDGTEDVCESSTLVLRRRGLSEDQALLLEPPHLRIAGHADSRGTNEYNQGLSERRAASAKRYFTGKTVDPNRITTVGFGEDQPAAPNTSAAGMAKNRRVEFTFEFYIPSQPQP